MGNIQEYMPAAEVVNTRQISKAKTSVAVKNEYVYQGENVLKIGAGTFYKVRSFAGQIFLLAGFISVVTISDGGLDVAWTSKSTSIWSSGSPSYEEMGRTMRTFPENLEILCKHTYCTVAPQSSKRTVKSDVDQFRIINDVLLERYERRRNDDVSLNFALEGTSGLALLAFSFFA